MKFTLNRKEVAGLIKTVSSCVGSRNMLPILGNVLLETKEMGVQLTCTNLEQRISAFCIAEVEENGATTVPVKKLLSLLNAMSGDDVSFNTDDNHHTTISCGSSRVCIPGLPPGDFPASEAISAKTTITINSEDLTRIFDHVTYAVGLNDARKALSGVLFSIHDNEITTVATDGKRLAYCPVTFTVPFDEDASFIIPIPAVQFLRSVKANRKVTLAFTDKKVTASVLNMDFESKLIEGIFPNWKQVVPTMFSKKTEIDSDVFLEKLAVIQLISSETQNVKCSIKNGILGFRAESTTDGSADDSLKIDFNCADDETYDIMLNPAMMIAAVKACSSSEKFSMSFNDSMTPVGFSFSDGSCCIIMPIRNK